jgi:hypothetical protein
MACLSATTLIDHAFCPKGKEVFVVITNTVKFTVSGSPGDK